MEPPRLHFNNFTSTLVIHSHFPFSPISLSLYTFLKTQTPLFCKFFFSVSSSSLGPSTSALYIILLILSVNHPLYVSSSVYNTLIHSFQHTPTASSPFFCIDIPNSLQKISLFLHLSLISIFLIRVSLLHMC